MAAANYNLRELSPKYGQTKANLDLKISYNNNTNMLGWKTDEEKIKILTTLKTIWFSRPKSQDKFSDNKVETKRRTGSIYKWQSGDKR